MTHQALPSLADLDAEGDPFAAAASYQPPQNRAPASAPSAPFPSPKSIAQLRPASPPGAPDPDASVVAIQVRSATPLSFVRSALFGVGASRSGPMVSRMPVPLAGDALQATMTYKGPRLNQRHALVWQACVAAAATQRTHQLVISAAELLALLGGSTDGDAHKDLGRQLEELVEGTVKISTTYDGLTRTYVGHLIDNVERVMTVGKNPKLHHLTIGLSARITHLLRERVVLDTLPVKAKIPRNQLALWLIDWISSHSTVPTTSVAEIRRLCGSDIQSLAAFRFALRAALTRLEAKPIALIQRWRIDAQDRLHIMDKRPSTVVLLDAAKSERQLSKLLLQAAAVDSDAATDCDPVLAAAKPAARRRIVAARAGMGKVAL